MTDFTRKCSFLGVAVLFVCIAACSPKEPAIETPPDASTPAAASPPSAITGDVLVFAAGSLTAALDEMKGTFEAEHPGVNILLESSGSQTAARKLTELGRVCDVFLSADYTVIDNLLIPDHAAWQIQFARNELVVAYHKDAPRIGELSGNGWIDVILDPEIDVAYCNPDTAPCGYRAIQALQLAEKVYDRPGIAAQFLAKGNRTVRSQEPEVLSLIETAAADYALTYLSSAEDRSLSFLRLPKEINLSDPALKEHYAQAQVEILGTEPNTKITAKGEPMIYGLTIPAKAPNYAAAETFVAFLLEKNRGAAILAKNHIPFAVPSPTPTYAAIPDALKPFALPE